MQNNIIQTSSAKDIRDHVQLIQQVMQTVMKPNEHYGMIPGTKKNSLFQTGAQKLLATFQLGSDPEVIHTDETEFAVSYRVKVRLFNRHGGETVGYGIGECSSKEEKYSWKKAVSDAEFNHYPESRRRVKFYSSYQVNQVATNHKDVANTVLKMATKRALVGAVLTATAAGDIFTQDLEDMEPQTRDSIVSNEALLATQPTQANANSKATLKDIRDAISLLGNKTFTKEENGKTLLFVAGNCFLIKDQLKQMGFLYRKEQGAQYGDNYMDVTHLIEKSNPLGVPTPFIPTTYAALDDAVSKLGLGLRVVNIDGNDFADVTGSKVFENKDNLKALGFKWSNDDSKSWRFDMSTLAPQEKQNSDEKLTMSDLAVKAEIFGFELSKPEVDTKGGQWIKAIPIDNHSDYDSLKNELGFTFLQSKDLYVLKLAS